MIGTEIRFKGYVPAGFLDSGWAEDVIFSNRYVNKDEARQLVESYVWCTEITKIGREIRINPIFSPLEWWMYVEEYKPYM